MAVCVHRHAKGFGLETTRLLLPPSASYHEVYDFGSGCLCCSPKGELVRVLAELTGRPLGALVIETTGVADPTPFLKLLLEEEVARDFAIAAVVCVRPDPAPRGRAKEQLDASTHVLLDGGGPAPEGKVAI